LNEEQHKIFSSKLEPLKNLKEITEKEAKPPNDKILSYQIENDEE
jgi:hypothetical protein